MKRTILIIEDNSDTRFLYSVALEESDFDVQCCINAKEAISFLRKNSPPALIISDLMMPGMDGDQFIIELRNNHLWSTIPVIVISGVENLEERALQVGATDFLKKPFDLKQLELTLSKHI
jgi:CheY-like chemotaxis protein